MLTPTYGANKPAMPQSAEKSTVIVNLDDQTIFFMGYVTPIEGVDGANIRYGGRQIVDYGFNVAISGNIDLWVRGSSVRLRGSLWTTGYCRNDRNYRDARRSRLRSAAIGGLRVLQLRARLLGWLRTLASWVLGRLRVWVVKLSLVCCDRSLATV
jgi:hypothetical protein